MDEFASVWLLLRSNDRVSGTLANPTFYIRESLNLPVDTKLMTRFRVESFFLPPHNFGANVHGVFLRSSAFQQAQTSYDSRTRASTNVMCFVPNLGAFDPVTGTWRRDIDYPYSYQVQGESWMQAGSPHEMISLSLTDQDGTELAITSNWMVILVVEYPNNKKKEKPGVSAISITNIKSGIANLNEPLGFVPSRR